MRAFYVNIEVDMNDVLLYRRQLLWMNIIRYVRFAYCNIPLYG